MKRNIILFMLITVNLCAILPTEAHKYSERGILYSNGILKKGGDLNWRTNNPGNLKYGSFAKKYGAIGSVNGFSIFPSMKQGYFAQMRLLRIEKYINKTVTSFLEIYAPSDDDNDLKKYKKFIKVNLPKIKEKKLGYLTYKELKHLVWVISIYEGMTPGDTYKKK